MKLIPPRTVILGRVNSRLVLSGWQLQMIKPDLRRDFNRFIDVHFINSIFFI